MANTSATTESAIEKIGLSLSGTDLTISILEDGELFQDTASLAPLTSSDDQALSLSGNILTLEDGGTVDLSPFLDNSDDQIITAFVLSPTGILTLSIEGGNTITVDLSSLDTDTDDQTLALAGTLLSISEGNSVDVSAFFDDTDISGVALSLSGQDLTVSVTEDGVAVSDTITLPPSTVTLNKTFRTVYVEEFAGGSENGAQSGAWSRNSTTVRIGTGQWLVQFASAHPDGTDYAVDFGQSEDGNRDVPKVHWLTGSKTANGFTARITVDDNGTGADILSDQPWSWSVDSPVQLLEDVDVA